MKKHVIVLFLFILFSCEMIVDVDVPFSHARLTANSFFNPDSVWSATLCLNRHILNDTSIQKVENAFVAIYRDGSPIDTLIHQENGLYKSDTGKPMIGIEYEIRASAENYETVGARSQIPLPAQILRAVISQGEPMSDGRPNNTINITFRDNVAETNYYHVIVEAEYEHYDVVADEIRTNRSRISIESNDPAIRDDNPNWYEGILMKDVIFNGKEVELSFKAPNTDISFSAAIIVILRSLSEDYYQYKTTVQLQSSTSGDPFAQPVNVHNNIENGFGIFAGFSESTFVQEIDSRPVITGINPMKGKPGDHVIISVENFIARSWNFHSVSFNGAQSPVYVGAVQSTANEIEVIIPDRAITGKIVVYSGGRVAVSDMDFEVTN